VIPRRLFAVLVGAMLVIGASVDAQQAGTITGTVTNKQTNQPMPGVQVYFSRTRTVRIGTTNFPGLPAVTEQGVPQSTGCVPRTKAGKCGTLMDALMYERGELMAADPYRGWLDRRGFGLLPKGTILHMPIPARYLVSMGLALYSFGGVGNTGAAQ
jgi:hypothetical protein